MAGRFDIGSPGEDPKSGLFPLDIILVVIRSSRLGFKEQLETDLLWAIFELTSSSNV